MFLIFVERKKNLEIKSKKKTKLQMKLFWANQSLQIFKTWNLKNLWSSYHDDDRTAQLPQDIRKLSKNAPTKMTTNSLIPGFGESERQYSVQWLKMLTLYRIKLLYLLRTTINDCKPPETCWSKPQQILLPKFSKNMLVSVMFLPILLYCYQSLVNSKCFV